MGSASAIVIQTMGDWMGGGWWLGMVGMVVWALLLAAVVLVVVRLVVLPVVEGMDEGAGDDALDVLRERFARGEIDEEEFERRAETLRRTRREW